jgi:hypothetical protein
VPKVWQIYIPSLFLLLSSQVLFSQDILHKEVVIGTDKYIADKLLDSLHTNLDVIFVYSDIIQPDRQISISPGKYTLKQVLDSILTIHNFKYITRGNLIILSPQTVKNIEAEKYVVQGKVMSKRDDPVPFATVYFENSSKGTIANNNGEFRFIIASESIMDTLTISSIGFESMKISPEIYLSQNLEIHLKTANIPIKNIIVRPENPEDIVMKSYEKRIQNYSSKTVFLTAFFRETSMQNSEYISLSEALIEISKSSYISSSDDLIRLVKGRNGANINQSELVNLVVQGGLYNGLRLDVAKYGSFFYTPEALQEYDFRMLKSTFYRDRQTYIIVFDMKEGQNYAGYKGNLYIDAESLALVRAEFEVSDKGLKYAKSALVKKTPKGFTAKPLYARYEVEYRFYNNVWNLHYAHSNIGFKVKKSGKRNNGGFSCNFVSTSEFVVTGINENPADRIKYRESVRPDDVLVQQVQNTGEFFWFDDNIIIPEEPLMNTIAKLRKEGLIPAEHSTLSKEEKAD